jgi:multicomponent Na+:H+ antiporter subunit A
MVAALVAFALVAMLLPMLTPALKRWIFLVAALVPFGAFVLTLTFIPTVIGGGEVNQSFVWVAELSLSLAFRVDALSLILALVVTGVGTLVMFYCVHYFSDDEVGLGRFAGVLLAFAGSMYGLVVANDVYILFVFWEATSVFSYLLIGHYTSKKASRGAALQALMVTTFGGLVMLVGLVLISVETGTSSLSGIIAAAPTGTIVTVSVMLILVGALSKSAIFPFHFWLPAAMAAPTPVSAYLHAAAMVKGGIYLIARLAPAFATVPGWREVLVILGVITMLLGGWAALRQTDLKLILAHGTVSQLGFLTVVVGYGSRETALAGVALLLAHALFKSTLFLVVGIIDHRAGTRDLTKLSGLGKEAPVLAVTAAIALVSMCGLPPAIGFVAKEAVFGALILEAGAGSIIAVVAIIGVALGSVLTVAYSARFFWGAFWRKPGVETVRAVHEQADFLSAPIVLAIAGLGLGLAAPFVDSIATLYASSFDGGAREPYHLALWHGFEPALAVSALTILLGAALFAMRGRRREATAKLAPRFSAGAVYWASVRFVERVAVRITSLTQRGSLPFYVSVILIVFIASTGAGLVLNRSWPEELRGWDNPAQLVIGLVMVVAAVAATRATKRFQGVVLVGVTGYGMAALFAIGGAPDLALTQIIVEVVTLVAFVLVLRRLPARLGERHGSSHRVLRAVIASTFGISMALIALVAAGARVDAPISLSWPQLAFEQGHGRNVVNVALVDLRGWDTMGELSVIIAAATGVASLVFINGRADNLPRVKRKEARKVVRSRQVDSAADVGRSAWLLGGRSLADQHRSILFEVVVRLVFHAIIVVSLYLLFAGHNAPGGGFAGGLVAGIALVARYLAGGREELGAAAPFDAGKLLGAGLVLAVGTATVPLFFGADALTSTFFEADVWLFGHIEFVTSTIFDIGVYLVVIGLTLDVLRSLGAEVDRQYETDAGVDSSTNPTSVEAAQQ